MFWQSLLIPSLSLLIHHLNKILILVLGPFSRRFKTLHILSHNQYLFSPFTIFFHFAVTVRQLLRHWCCACTLVIDLQALVGTFLWLFYYMSNVPVILWGCMIWLVFRRVLDLDFEKCYQRPLFPKPTISPKALVSQQRCFFRDVRATAWSWRGIASVKARRIPVRKTRQL
jgi:hypothetical protein